MNWNPITKVANDAAEALGHKLGQFRSHKGMSPMSSGNAVKTAMCDTCFGCCWIAWSVTRGFGAGGRLLKFRCGTPEAAGLERASLDAEPCPEKEEK